MSSLTKARITRASLAPITLPGLRRLSGCPAGQNIVVVTLLQLRLMFLLHGTQASLKELDGYAETLKSSALARVEEILLSPKC